MTINNVFSQTLPIMLALCLMLLATYYAQNNAGIIDWSLTRAACTKLFSLYTYLHKILESSTVQSNYNFTLTPTRDYTERAAVAHAI